MSQNALELTPNPKVGDLQRPSIFTPLITKQRGD